MKRRVFISLLGGAAIVGPTAALAQRAKLTRIGFLRVGPPPATFLNGFLQGLRDLGLVEGQHFVLQYGLAQNAAQVPGVAAELVARGIDILIASGTPSVFPARDAAGQIPVVFIATFDPVATGLVSGLARPGRNITGQTSISGDIIAKRLELTKELLPDLTRIAILVRESSPTAAQYVQESRSAAQHLGIDLEILTERNPNELEPILARLARATALVVADDAEFTALRARIAELALKHQLPSVSGLREMVVAGGLMAYGASFAGLYRRAATQVHKIMQGASAGDLPVEQPVKFEFVVNLRTAKALSLTMAPSLLARADEVIE